MRKILVMLALGLGITFAANAQQGKKKGSDLTVEQKTELAVKRMVLELDLTDGQVRKIKPLIQEKVAQRQLMKEKRKSLKGEGKEVSSEEKFEKANRNLDKKIAFKNKMKQILTPEQMVKFEKMRHKKGRKGKNRGKSCEKSCEGAQGKSCEGKK